MAVPKRKTSLHRKRTRRAHHAIGKPNLRPCAHCGQYSLPHRVCTYCGTYKGVQYIEPKSKVEKKQRNNQDNTPA